MAYHKGKWNVVCDRCGFEFHNSELRKEWTGLMVCSQDFDKRHPQDFVRGVHDRQSVPWVRPDPEPVFLTTNEVTASDL